MGDGWTFLLLKPDATGRRLQSAIRGMLAAAGLRALERGCGRLSAADIDTIYGPFTFARFPAAHALHLRQNYVSYLTAGTSEYWQLEAEGGGSMGPADLVSAAKRLQGADFRPDRCAEGSMRFELRDPARDGRPAIATVVDGFGQVAAGQVHNLTHTPASIAERDYQAPLLLAALGWRAAPRDASSGDDCGTRALRAP